MLSLLSLLLVSVASAAPPDGEAWVRARLLDPVDRAEAAALGVGFLEGGRGPWRHLAVTPAQAEALSARGIALSPLPLPPPDAADGYPSPEGLTDALLALAEAHPALAEPVQIGLSEQGRGIWALRISASPAPAVGWRVLGDHHGDEPSSGVVALATAEHLLGAYGADPALTALLDSDAVWIAPMVNPDGVALASRYNANTVDLNRNYGHEWSPTAFRAGPSPFSEPETRAVRAHGAWTALGAGLSMHSGETNLGWVWNHSTAPTPDATLLEEMARSYGAACATPGFWITNGAEWYPTTGDTNDWAYGRHGVLDFTLEVTLDKAPPAGTLPAVIDDHVPAVMALLTWPHRATGQVVDAETGLPTPATVQLGGARLTTGPGGRFGRPVGAAPVIAEVSAPGYHPASVSIRPGEPIEVRLTPAALTPVRSAPPVLSQSGDGVFHIDTTAGSVSLVRPGELSVAATPSGGGWQVDPGRLAPGPWTLVVDGAVAPRALFVGEHDDRVRIGSVTLTGAAVHLEGQGFGAGTRAWALAGVARSPVPVGVLSRSATAIELDTRTLEGLEDPVDLLVLSSGYQLAVVDVFGEAEVDTGAPGGTDTGTRDDPGGRERVSTASPRAPGCGCQASPAVPAASLVVTLLVAIRRRSR